MARTVADQVPSPEIGSGYFQETHPQDLFKSAITVEMAKGFTLYMMKVVMNGRGDDLVDLAKANLWA